MKESKDMGLDRRTRRPQKLVRVWLAQPTSNLERSFGLAHLLRNVFRLAINGIALSSPASAPSSSPSCTVSFDL